MERADVGEEENGESEGRRGGGGRTERVECVREGERRVECVNGSP